MPEHALSGCRVLVVEDEYLIADQLSACLDDRGAIVLGPVATVESALNVIKSGESIDCAILDVNLGGEKAYPAADALIQREVPFLFTTGYESSVLPTRFVDVVRCEKPISIRRFAEAMARIVHA